MRNNSLRQQVWQNKQQANIFKKVAQIPLNQPYEDSLSPQNTYKTNIHQHSQLKWLQKMVNENGSKEGQREEQALRQKRIDQTTAKERSLQAGSIGQNRKGKKIRSQQEKAEQRKPSGQKVKLEIVPFGSSKQNKLPSQRKSSSKTGDKIKNKSNKKIMQASALVQQAKPKQQEINFYLIAEETLMPKRNKESTKEQESLDRRGHRNMWEQGRKDFSFYGYNSVNSHQKTTPTVGKIIKNRSISAVDSSISSKIFNNEQKPINRQQKQAQSVSLRGLTAKREPQKLCIKLHTQKLSKYLIQSDVREIHSSAQQPNQLVLKNEQLIKYCTTKRGDHIVSKAVHVSMNLQSDVRLIDQTQVIQRKRNVERNMNTNDSKSKSTQNGKQSNYMSYKKQRGILQNAFSNHSTVQRRNKSQQRKLNQFSRTLTQYESVHQATKEEEIQLVPSFSFKKRNSHIQREIDNKSIHFQDRQRKQEQLQGSNMKIEKIFTLNSEKDEDDEKRQAYIPKILQKQNHRLSEHTLQSKNLVQILQNTVLTQFQPKNIKLSPKSGQKPKQTAQSQHREAGSQNYCEMLKQLFNFLDIGKRSLLSNSNCKANSLTEELKLLLSPIINQIRSKKKTYNVQKFMAEGQQVLKVKQEVYKTSRTHLNKPKISQILRENIQILIKRAPLDFLQHTYTYSCYQSQQNSKRESSKDDHSVVIAKVMMQKKAETHSSIQPNRLAVQKSKLELRSFGLRQPELYLQQKYEIDSSQFHYKVIQQPFLQEFTRSICNNDI